jgi:hypothetical protein
MERKVILVDYEIQEKILHEIESLKQLLTEKKSKKADDGIQWMDNNELMEYLHVCRRTTLTLRQRGLPCSQISGKILYRKDHVDTFITEHKLNASQLLLIVNIYI